MSLKKILRVAHFTAEVSPYSKVGGLGDVGYALPKAIGRLGHDIIIITPLYGSVRAQHLNLERVPGETSVVIDGIEYPVRYFKFVSPDNFPIYFVDNEELFASHKDVYHVIDDEALRWIFFARAGLELFRLIQFAPDIIHLHDWTSALAANYLRAIYRTEPLFKDTAVLYTIHNLAYQGTRHVRNTDKNKLDKGSGAPPEEKSFRKYINFMKRGIVNAHAISTVSERYAKEITTPEFGAGLDPYLKRRIDRVFGIINGIDYEVINPAFDEDVYVRYDVNSLDKKQRNKVALQKEVGLTIKKTTPIIGIINRLTEQKGFKLIIEAMPTLLKMDLQIVVVGSGERDDYIKFFRDTARKHRSVVGIYSPFTQKMASRVYAGSNLYLMPSRYEPCGISQLVSLRYGSIPIVRSVGGLHDTVTDYDPATDTGNGFTFSSYTASELLVAIARATESFKYTDSWNKLVYRAMKQSFSWELPAKKYVQLYHIAIKLKQQETHADPHHS